MVTRFCIITWEVSPPSKEVTITRTDAEEFEQTYFVKKRMCAVWTKAQQHPRDIAPSKKIPRVDNGKEAGRKQ